MQMFSKISRYRKLPDEVTVDVNGRRLESKSLRLLPEVTGTFLHNIEDSNRLDQLADKYYKQPRKWWRICDANPEFMSPQALLGKGPIVTQRFPLSFSNTSSAPWALLLASIADLVGVEDIWLAEDEASVVITYNQMSIQPADLVEAIETAGFAAEQPQSIGRTGKQIVIPPDIVG
jgi:hypothetical protein